MFTTDLAYSVTGADSDATVRVRELTVGECYQHLAEDCVGRVVYTRDALPAITPVNYALDGHRIVFRTAAESRFAWAISGQVVAFEVDHLDRDRRSGWSVVVTGIAAPLTDTIRAAALSITPWAGGQRQAFFAVTSGSITGRTVEDGT